MTALSPDARKVLADLVADSSMRIGPSTLDELARLASLPRRAVEAAVNELALAGYPVVTATSGDDRGVRLTDDPAEVRACADALGRRVSHQYRRVRALRRTAAALSQPKTLWGEP